MVFSHWKKTLELQITLLLTSMFPPFENWKTIRTVLSYTCFAIALSWVDNYDIPQICPKISLTQFWQRTQVTDVTPTACYALTKRVKDAIVFPCYYQPREAAVPKTKQILKGVRGQG